MNKTYVWAFIGIVIIAALGFYTYDQYFLKNDDNRATGRLAEILNRGELVVGLDATYAPLESLDANKDFVGLDVDIAREIAKDIGVKVTFKNVPWDNIFDSVKKGDIDFSNSSITITAERAQTLGFSDPYFNAGQVIVSTTAAASRIQKPEDLQGLRVGAQINTTSDTQAQKYTSLPLITRFEEYTPAVKDLLAGKIDAIIIDYPAAVGIVNSNKGLSIVSPIFTQEFYGVATQKGEQGLLLSINKTIRRLKEDGTLKTIQDRWLGH